ncbi:MAG: T9SS type A sorting domain-containing protein, partial [Bacteroidales bacterium]|nr:T9SS type A sorting domain-containing protein [Bacteroidales bacterium]
FLPAPTVTFDSLPDICDNDPPYELTEGNPPGGTYSGNGVTNGYFYPSVAGLGTHIITYTFTDTTNLCSDTATQTILVDNCSGISEISNGLCVNIFPNPNNGNFVLELNSENNIAANIRIFNSLNVLVYEINKVNINQKYSKKINLSRLSKGVYFLMIKSNKVVLVYKIIIQN